MTIKNKVFAPAIFALAIITVIVIGIYANLHPTPKQEFRYPLLTMTILQGHLFTSHSYTCNHSKPFGKLNK